MFRLLYYNAGIRVVYVLAEEIDPWVFVVTNYLRVGQQEGNMSQFDSYSKADYVDRLRVFLGEPEKGFHARYQLTPPNYVSRKGRLPTYREESVAALEELVNLAAERCEGATVSIAERLSCIRAYAEVTGTYLETLNKALGAPAASKVSSWIAGMGTPTEQEIESLAPHFHVTAEWLKTGNETTLPADSPVGVRVGSEALLYREQLYARTIQLTLEIPEEAAESYAQAYIEWAVKNKPDFKTIARRAGGRWQLVQGNLLFAPWTPIEDHGLTRRFWSDEVENIIGEELLTNPSIYSAWSAIKARCTEKGLAFPSKIALYKRLDRERERIEKYGLNLNSLIQESVAKYSQAH